MTGQIEEVIGEVMHFLQHESPGSRLGLLIQAVEVFNDKHGLFCGRFRELNLPWCIPTVQTGFGDQKRTSQQLLKKQGKLQGIPSAKVFSESGWQVQAVGRENHLPVGGEAGKRRFVDKV